MTSSEKEILILLKSGNTAAFDRIYHKYYNNIYAFTYSLLKNHYDTEEIIQDVFVTLWHKRDQINVELNFKNYLSTICFNTTLKFFRRQKIENKVKDYLINSTNLKNEDTKNSVIYNELKYLIDTTIYNLPEKRRRVFNLSRKEGKSIREIAEILKISPRAVETHISRALKVIRLELKKASVF